MTRRFFRLSPLFGLGNNRLAPRPSAAKTPLCSGVRYCTAVAPINGIRWSVPLRPAWTAGAGKPRSELTLDETEQLGTLQMEFDELMPGTFLSNEDTGDDVKPDPRRFQK